MAIIMMTLLKILGRNPLLLILMFLLIVSCQDSIFDFAMRDIDGNMVSLEKYKDSKAILIVNVASKCGFTYKNYKELVDLYDRLHSKGLEILAFPCNQFGEQEPASNQEIKTFVQNYGVQFPVFAKIDVNGPSTNPLYRFLKFYTGHAEIQWNFQKILVVNGMPVKRYVSRISPLKIEGDLLPYLESSNNPTKNEDL